jgi:lipopolysaccharide transport system ATP-binding protein
MSNGTVAFDGAINTGVDFYLNAGRKNSSAFYENPKPKPTDILSVRIINDKNESTLNFDFASQVILEFTVRIEEKYNNAMLGFRIKDQTERNVFTSQFDMKVLACQPGVHTIKAIIPSNTLVPNRYSPIVALHVPNIEVINYLEDQLMFEIEETGTDFFQYAGNDYGCVFVDCKWQ